LRVYLVTAAWHLPASGLTAPLRPVAALLAPWLTAPVAAADDFEARCAQMFGPTRIVVVYEDRALERDDTLDIEALEGVAARRGDPTHGCCAWHVPWY